MNVWFLRMDKYSLDNKDFGEKNAFIHSAHGSCDAPRLAKEHKDKVFPELALNGKDLAKLIRSIKYDLIKNGQISLEQSGKRRCDIAIRYWVSVMQVGDLVFVRNKQNKIILSRITDYISEVFFEDKGAFKRPVEIINEITESMVPSEIWERTKGRKTIERNAKKHITDWVVYNYESLTKKKNA